MAEALDNKKTTNENKDKEGHLECAVCLQKCIHPAQLPCGHIFCFLCIKGFANQNKKCAMCRQEIPRDFTEHPNLLDETLVGDAESFDEGYQWFYEGRNGWWQYDERTSKDLECSYKCGEKTCELLIAGFLYIIDLENMLQIRRNDPCRRRRVKRDFATILKKGIAGLHSSKDVLPKNDNADQSASVEQELDSAPPATNSNTSQNMVDVETSTYEQDLQNTVEGMSCLSLNTNLF